MKAALRRRTLRSKIGPASTLIGRTLLGASIGFSLVGCDSSVTTADRDAGGKTPAAQQYQETEWLAAPNFDAPESDLSPPVLRQLSPVPKSIKQAGSNHQDLAASIELAFDSSDLASFVGEPSHRLRLDFGGFDQEASDAREVKLVQAPAGDDLPEIPDVPEGFDVDEDIEVVEDKGVEDKGVGPSASDQGPVEMIPTPPARPEYKAEEIPTPQGIPERMLSRNKAESEPVARIAADLDPAKTSVKETSLSTTKKLEKSPAVNKLIDPENEIGLVGTQEGPEDYRQWPQPDAVLFITGDQHGYIEPCGCTGLEQQKGGVARRFTLMSQLRDMGWPLVPLDAGNQIRRIGRQASIKFEKSSSALAQMKYQSVGFGPLDMRLGLDLLAHTQESPMYVSANVVLFDPEFVPSHKIVKRGDWSIGITSVLDPDSLESPLEDGLSVEPMKEAASKALAAMNDEGASFRVITFYGKEEVANKLMQDVPGFDLIVVSGGYGEPTYRPQSIPDSETKLIVTGNKGMYAGLVGLYAGADMKYARVPLSHEFKDAPEMRALMKDYQQDLEQLGLSGLGITPIPHSSNDKYVGTAKCGQCHTTAMEIWEGSHHALATEHIVTPTEGRGDVARHFDPECLSCHVTGWDPQGYRPYESGYLDLEKSVHLHGNGCENCHGPGAEHSAAEEENSGVSEERKQSLRLAMQLPLERAKEHCMKCHDLDNSPDFHDEDAFEDVYWPEIEHYGTD